MAVDDINKNKTILPNYDLSLDIKDGKCEPDVVMKMFIDIIRTKSISRFSSTVGVLGKCFYIYFCKEHLLEKVLAALILWRLLLVFLNIIAQSL